MTREELCPNCFIDGFQGHCLNCDYTHIRQNNGSMMLSPGTVLTDRYYLGRILGAGGFGITYLAKDMKTGHRIAIKEYLPSMLAVRDQDTLDVYASSGDNQQIFLHGRDMFLKEAKILKLFQGDERIVQVMDSFCFHGTAYFAMEYLDGINVKQLMRSMGDSLSAGMAKEIMLQTGEALKLVHEKGLLHRDVSPENIIITRDGTMKLIDFGATRFFMGEKSRSLSVIIKPGFAPPEQYSSRGNQGAWTDVYALCATIWHGLCGQSVPDAPSRLAGEPMPQLSANLKEELGSMVSALEKGLSIDYRKRWQTMEALIMAAGESSGASAKETPKQQPVIHHQIQGNPYIQLIKMGHAGDKWTIPKQMQMVIGRSSDVCHLVIDDPNISRSHCTVHYDGKTGEFYVSDQSSNGTYVARIRLEYNRLYPLQPGGVFELIPGRIAMKVGVE